MPVVGHSGRGADAGHEAEVGGDLARGAEAARLAELGEQGGRGEEADAGDGLEQAQLIVAVE